jgi:hypothetical protein
MKYIFSLGFVVITDESVKPDQILIASYDYKHGNSAEF